MMSELKQTIATLEQYAAWRLDYEGVRMMKPREITKALKHAIEVLKLTESLLEKNV